MRGTLLAVTLLILGACSSETTGSTAASCSDVSGNYDVTATRLGGSCPPGDADGRFAVTVLKKSNGEWNVAFPGIEGGCPAEFDQSSCKMSALCKVVDLQTSKTLATLNLDYTFSSTGFTGTIAGTQSPPIVTEDCDATARHEGKKL